MLYKNAILVDVFNVVDIKKFVNFLIKSVQSLEIQGSILRIIFQNSLKLVSTGLRARKTIPLYLTNKYTKIRLLSIVF
nr:MAG TPA: hypothetical protein [Caudoviricetes sp.]